MRGKGLVGVLALACFVATPPCRAEVAARLDENGNYVGMYIRKSASSPPRIWSSAPPTAFRRPLNVTGDLLGDQHPVVAENPVSAGHPWVIWQHPNGADYDLLFSRWTGTGWTPPQFVQMDTLVDERDPVVRFNSVGRPYMAWWAGGEQSGAVYFSVFLQSRWMTPVMINAPGEDARHPSIKVADDLHVAVTYISGGAMVERMVTLPSSDTITDDIDPQYRMEIDIE